MIPKKYCATCKTVFIKPLNFGKAKWDRKKFCSIKCSSKAQIGVPKQPHTEDFKRAVSLRHRGKVNSPETRRKMGTTKLGPLNPGWKGGITAEHILARNVAEYGLWHEAVLKRDNYRCVFCLRKRGWDKAEKKQVKMEVDHIKPFALYPELRYAIDNGRTLCVDCHKKTPTYGARKYPAQDGLSTNQANPSY